jgi:hypothetical protein
MICFEVWRLHLVGFSLPSRASGWALINTDSIPRVHVVATDEMLNQNKTRCWHKKLLRFLKQIEQSETEVRDGHLIDAN